MSEEREDVARAEAEMLRVVTESDGWKRVILPWLMREYRNKMTQIKFAHSLRTEDLMKEYLLGAGPIVLIENFLKMIDLKQGKKTQQEELKNNQG